MSLYDDVILPEFAIKIPQAVVTQSNGNSNEQNQTPSNTKTKKEIEIASWNTNSLKLLQNQVEAAKKRQQTLNSASYLKANLKQTLNASPVLGADKRKPLTQLKKDLENETKQVQSIGTELRFNLITGKVEKEDSLIASTLEEEYDPMRPNDYEKVVIELKKNKINKRHSSSSSRSRSRSRRRRSRSSTRSRSSSRGRKRRSRRSSEEEANKLDAKKPEEPAKKYNNFAPPPSLIESDSKPLIENPDEIKPISTSAKLKVGLFKAEKMMAKMGYKEGEGLGKNNQGMSIALQVEKTGRRSGRIIHEKDVPEPPTPTNSAIISASPVIIKNPVIHKDPSTPVGIPAEVMKNMSKVILLKNMVTRSEVDSDLEGETKEECEKYGEVNTCVIHVMENKIEEEAVRIFVEFKTLPSAIKALTDLNGRFFGGRVVKATFYNLDKFKRRELSDDM